MTHESEVGAVDVWRVRLHYVPSMDLAARLVECCPSPHLMRICVSTFDGHHYDPGLSHNLQLLCSCE